MYLTGKPAGAQTSGDAEYTLVVNSDGSLNVVQSGSTGAVANTTYAASVQVTATGTPGTLLAAPAVPVTRKVAIFQAPASNTAPVRFGPATVTATTGAQLAPGKDIVLTGSDVPLNLTQVISESGSQVVIVTTGT